MKKDILPVKIEGVILDQKSRSFVVILKDEIHNKYLPIFIGAFEAQAIALELDGVKLPRPGTHDLIINLKEAMAADIVKVCVCDLKENTFYAVIELRHGGKLIEVDSRPSDAIAVAIRAKVPVFVAREIMDKAGVAQLPTPNDTPQMPYYSKNISDLERLRLLLNEAVQKENYEEASELRDKIKKLTGQNG